VSRPARGKRFAIAQTISAISATQSTDISSQPTAPIESYQWFIIVSLLSHVRGDRRPARSSLDRHCDQDSIKALGTQRPSRSRFSASALTATMMLEPDMEMAAISGRSVKPQGSKTPAAIGRASEL
jgi:hypothetical protein